MAGHGAGAAAGDAADYRVFGPEHTCGLQRMGRRAAATGNGVRFMFCVCCQKFDVPGTNYETIIGLAEIVPNVNIGRHTHPGPESGFMLEGDFVLLVEGNAPLPVKAGESYKVPPGAIHDARTGANGAKVIATYVVEKGKPLATPTP